MTVSNPCPYCHGGGFQSGGVYCPEIICQRCSGSGRVVEARRSPRYGLIAWIALLIFIGLLVITGLWR